MKTIEDIIKEEQEQQIDESFAGFAIIAAEISLLVFAIGVFAKSFKEIAKGENGMLDVAKKLLDDMKINKICKKLAKDEDIQKILLGKENLNKDAFETAVRSKLSEKEAQYFFDITRDNVEKYIKKQP